MTLVLVLIMLVLLLGVVLSILFTAQSERALSSQFASASHSRKLAEMAVNTCIAQVADATSAPGRAWISQPGLIRTFTGNRQPGMNYRLYSWGEMRPDGAFDPFAEENRVPPAWKSQPSLFVDLNEPMADLGNPQDRSKDKYPILYPKSLTSFGEGTGTNVAGFEISTPPGNPSSTENPVPMPVQWLYVLRDGRLEVGSDVDGAKVKVAAASESNPIVGRIAFWADDETAKVNVNTAAGGAFWSEPRFETSEERPGGLGFGWTQPVKNEFQRYPGHPARTDLRAVFPELSYSEIYKLVAKVEEGGSQNGTQPFKQAPIVPDLDRLYSGIGEMRFGVKDGDSGRPLQKEVLTPFSGGTADDWDNILEKRKAFLTTTSRAPELTLFGTPRVCLWPISASTDAARHTALDRLLAFCSTVTSGANKYPFHFSRINPRSSTEDVNLPRNLDLLAYLRRLTGNAIPGHGEVSFGQKYSEPERDQILTEIFDYVRITNLQDMQLSSGTVYASDAVVFPTEWTPPSGQPTRGFGRTYSLRQVGFIFICNADGGSASDPQPHASNSTQNRALGGQTLAPYERTVQVLFFVELFSPSAGLKMMNAAPRVKISGLENLELSSSLTGPTPMGFVNDPNGSTAPGVITASYSGGFGANGGAVNYRWLYMLNNTPAARDVRTTGALTTNDSTSWPYISIPVTLKYGAGQSDPTMTIGAGKITVQILLGNTVANEVEVNLDEVVLPMPRPHPNPEYWVFHKSGYNGSSTGRFARAVLKEDNSTPDPNVPLITRYDSVQSYILPHGDYRHLFGNRNDVKTFVPAPQGTEPALRHFLSDNNRIVYGSNLSTAFAPGFTSRIQHGAVMHPGAYPEALNKPWDLGDWDTGSSMVMTDGPLINKVDEGSIYLMTSTSVTNPYRSEYALAGAGDNTYGQQSGVTAGGYHSANRQMPSAVMLGSLPTGMVSGKVWKTLLFRPTEADHPGKNDPPDHLLLDLFWMPVVEPYAISEPFSTAGKINMNYQMIPFTYIERSTGVRSILMNEKILAVPDTAMASGYKKHRNDSGGNFTFATPIDVEETMQPFKDRFANGDVFLTPGEITEQYLVSDGWTYADMPAFWQAHRLTGDNLKERPYAHIYPRLTTKSNVFNVHHRVQVLRKKPGSSASEWDESSDKVVAEARGNTIIERYIDVNRPGIPDFATDSSANAEALYRFRVLARKEFKP